MDANEGNLLAALLMAAAIGALVLVFFIITTIHYHRKHMRLHRERLGAEMRGMERERQRVATDLHDQLGAVMASIKYQVSALEPANEEDARIIEDLQQHMDMVIQEIRSIVRNLQPLNLRTRGFYESIELFIAALDRNTSTRFSIITSGSNLPMPEDAAQHIYRMIQEMAANTLKHSGARQVRIEMHRTATEFRLRFEDDGCGFEMRTVETADKGFGLRNIANRVELLRGRMIIGKGKVKGSLIKIVIPIQLKDGENKSSNCGRPGDIQRRVATGVE